MARVKDLKQGEMFTLKKIEEPSIKQVWVRDRYWRSSGNYSVFNYYDVDKEMFLKGDTEVFTDFTF
jgi:hypothetical protein